MRTIVHEQSEIDDIKNNSGRINMASHKEHHYIPQFHLRRFCTDAGQKFIGLYHHQNKFLFYKAPIRKQARIKNYYGSNGKVEGVLSVIEGFAAIVIADIIRTCTLPAISSHDYTQLMYFILFQERRTRRAETTTNDQLNKLQETSYQKFGQTAPTDNISINEILLSAIDGINMCNYLRCQLLVNQTSIPFITSDNPVVMNNELMESLKQCSASGWASKGLQVFYPINPHLMLIWTDPFVYRCGGKTQREIIRTDIESDINQLNALQYLNCQDQVFFNQDFKKSHLQELVNKYHSTKINTLPGITSFGSFTFVTGIEYKIGLKLSFNKINKAGKNFRPGGRLVYLRHSQLQRERQHDSS